MDWIELRHVLIVGHALSNAKKRPEDGTKSLSKAATTLAGLSQFVNGGHGHLA